MHTRRSTHSIEAHGVQTKGENLAKSLKLYIVTLGLDSTGKEQGARRLQRYREACFRIEARFGFPRKDTREASIGDKN